MSATMFIRHQVNDYAAWKPIYDSLGALRKSMGVIGASVHREGTNANSIVVTHRFGTMDQALNFANSEELKSAMGRAGVSSQPEFWFTEDVEQTAF